MMSSLLVITNYYSGGWTDAPLLPRIFVKPCASVTQIQPNPRPQVFQGPRHLSVAHATRHCLAQASPSWGGFSFHGVLHSTKTPPACFACSALPQTSHKSQEKLKTLHESCTLCRFIFEPVVCVSAICAFFSHDHLSSGPHQTYPIAGSCKGYFPANRDINTANQRINHHRKSCKSIRDSQRSQETKNKLEVQRP